MKLTKEIREYMRAIGTKGGKSGTGQCKSRGSELARKAVNARWEKYRATHPK